MPVTWPTYWERTQGWDPELATPHRHQHSETCKHISGRLPVPSVPRNFKLAESNFLRGFIQIQVLNCFVNLNFDTHSQSVVWRVMFGKMDLLMI